VILFLDELILWLASHVADLPFVNREMEKLAKLVEAQSSDRPIPLISFVARQRDLRELVGDHVPGAEKLGFLDGLKWSDGRFHVVKLEDRNLPKIAGQRILRPRSDAARIQIDAAFRETLKARSDVVETLLTSGADQAMFREVYPFTPALIQTLVGVSSMLQRERTALRVMLQLLVNRRETLALGDVIPVGDLFDVISEGDEPFTEDMRVHFENAKRLYHQKLLPLLEKENQIRAEAVGALPSDDPQRKRFRAQDRLLKTLLLASLVPEVEALRELTAGRLSALNHGSIQTPIPGQEGAYVLGLCRRWAGTVGEIKIGAGTNPTIQVQISGIDVGPILDKVRGEDNTGNRRLKIRELLFSELGIEDHDKLYVDHAFPWRGSRREVSVIFGNVRELPDTSLRAADGDVKVVLDYPFDVEGHSPDEDVERLERFKESASGPSLTLCWLPHFLSRETLADLGTLVLLEHVLVGERFNDCASHLSAVDRAAARALLDNQRSSLRQRLISVIEGAYGVREAVDGTLDRSHEMEQPFHSLDPSFAPQPPVGAGLEDAFQHLLGQLMAHRYPDHPKFETDVKISALRKVLGEAERAVQAEGGRVIVEKELRPLLRQIADPLKLGQMYESAFILGQHWKNHFLKKAAEHGGQITVERLRAWTDEPRPMGLTKEVQNLLILVFADQTDRSFYRHGGPEVPSLEQLADDVELREQRLPPEVVWQDARLRAGAVFGLSPSPLRNAANVTSLARDLVEQAKAVGTSARTLAELVASRLRSMGADADVASRFHTAHAAMKLVAAISAGGSEGAIDALCAARLETSPQAVGKSLRQASELVRVLEGDSFRLLDGIRGLSDHRREAAQVILRHAREALEHDELAEPLRPALDKAAQDALALLTSTAPAPAKPAPGRKLIVQRAERDLTPERASGLLEEISEQLKPPNRRLSITWQIEDVGGGGS
ncbi:MAG: hypothetical protein KC766_15725, partial [Myxococcales bacterium]|nr:hypothetical protein [Myxococcales bacterium]